MEKSKKFKLSDLPEELKHISYKGFSLLLENNF